MDDAAEIRKLEEEIELCPATSYHQRPPRQPNTTLDRLQQARQQLQALRNLQGIVFAGDDKERPMIAKSVVDGFVGRIFAILGEEPLHQ